MFPASCFWRRGLVGIREISAEAGVSIATVSRVLSGADYPVRRATRERVLAVAAQLGYQPNLTARSFRRGSTAAVGVCCTTLSSLTTMSTVEGITDAIEDFGHYPQIAVSRWDAVREKEALELFLAERVAGVLSFPTQLVREPYARLQAAGVPVVLLNRSIVGVPAAVVRHDFAGGYRSVVESLAAAGHRRIAALLPGQLAKDADGQVQNAHAIAWHAALTRLGLEPRPDWQLPGGDSLDLVWLRQELGALFAAKDKPTALFCGLAAGTLLALRALAELGISVPDDVAVVGTTDEHWRPFIPQHIPVAMLDSYTLGARAAQLIEQAITTGRVTDDAEEIIGVDFYPGSDPSAGSGIEAQSVAFAGE
jgi:LacI family transcriptional regulator